MAVLTQVTPRRLFINSAAIFGGEAAARLATFIVAMVIARRFGPIALGQYGYALAWASILLLVPDFGLHLYVVRELSSGLESLRTMFWNVNWVKLLLAGAVLLFTAAFGAWGVPDGGRRILLYVLVIRILLQTFSQVCMAIFRAYEQMHYIAVQQFANTALVTVWTVVTLAFNASLPVVVLGLVLGQLLETCLGWKIMRTNFSPGSPSQWNSKIITRILLASLPIGVTAMLQAFNLRIDILVLGRSATDTALGQFQAAAYFPVAIFLVASLLMTVLFPKLSRLLRDEPARGSGYVLSLLKNGVLMTSLGGLLAWFAAPVLLPLVFGKGTAGAALTLRLLAPMFPLMFLNTVLFYVFIAARRRLVSLGTLGLGAVAGVASSLVLTSAYGAPGCALADVVRELIITTVFLFFLAREYMARSTGVALLKVLAGATVLTGIGLALTGPVQYGAQWIAAWVLLILTGVVATMGLPSRQEWRVLTDDSL